ncbi:IST1 homolog isoform X1 [Rhincodon typus]|uniref:IST1 homolog isoform X1 n=1 Tax=Rhincodon typus TaxID=259920 RepID=UPI00203025CD|nr:IST1 homolog isoform X1 [Rhincodon typus]
MPMPMPMPTPSIPFSYPPRKGPDNHLPVDTYQPFNNFQPPNMGGNPPPIPTQPPTYESIDDVNNTDTHLPSPKLPGPSVPIPAPRQLPGPAATPSNFVYDNVTIPELPSVPDTLPTASVGGTSTASEDIDFDDLSRRFEDLKKKT